MEWYIYAFGAAIFAAIAAIINKRILTHEHALEFTASRSIILLIITSSLIPFVKFNLSFWTYASLIFVAILVSAGLLFYMKSIRHGEISSIAPVMNISPMFLVILSYLILGEVPSTRQYFGVFLLILGMYSLEVGITNKGFIEPIRVFFKSKVIHKMIFAMVIFSIAATLDKLIISSYVNWQTYAFFGVLFRTAILIPLESHQNGFKEIIKDLKKDYKLLISDSLAVFFANVTYLLAVSIPDAMITLIIPIKRTATLFTTIFGGKLFHEKNLLIKVLACIIMIWGAIFILI